MRETLKDKNRLEHIISAIDIILNRSKRMTFEELTSDKLLYGGIVYHTMIIGEAAYMAWPRNRCVPSNSQQQGDC